MGGAVLEVIGQVRCWVDGEAISKQVLEPLPSFFLVITEITLQDIPLKAVREQRRKTKRVALGIVFQKLPHEVHLLRFQS